MGADLVEISRFGLLASGSFLVIIFVFALSGALATFVVACKRGVVKGKFRFRLAKLEIGFSWKRKKSKRNKLKKKPRVH